MKIKQLNQEELKVTNIYGKTVFISSYCFESLDRRVPEWQKKVFDHLGVDLNQFVGSSRHPEFLDFIVNNMEFDYFIFFDIDCIPLNANIIQYIMDIIDFDSIIGIEQQCNSNESINHIYAGPACFGISKKLYNELNRPSFGENSRSDVGEEITYICENLGKKVNFFKKTHSENEIWKLGDRFFGHGTTYENGLLYHQFQITQNVEKFITKCQDSIKNT